MRTKNVISGWCFANNGMVLMVASFSERRTITKVVLLERADTRSVFGYVASGYGSGKLGPI